MPQKSLSKINFERLFIWYRRKLFLAVTSVEFINTTCCIKQYVFTSIKWVRVRANLHFVNWICVTIFPNDTFFGIGTWFCHKFETCWQIPEYNWSIIWMNIFFHYFIYWNSYYYSKTDCKIRDFNRKNKKSSIILVVFCNKFTANRKTTVFHS